MKPAREHRIGGWGGGGGGVEKSKIKDMAGHEIEKEMEDGGRWRKDGEKGR